MQALCAVAKREGVGLGPYERHRLVRHRRMLSQGRPVFRQRAPDSVDVAVSFINLGSVNCFLVV